MHMNRLDEWEDLDLTTPQMKTLRRIRPPSDPSPMRELTIGIYIAKCRYTILRARLRSLPLRYALRGEIPAAV